MHVKICRYTSMEIRFHNEGYSNESYWIERREKKIFFFNLYIKYKNGDSE